MPALLHGDISNHAYKPYDYYIKHIKGCYKHLKYILSVTLLKTNLQVC